MEITSGTPIAIPFRRKINCDNAPVFGRSVARKQQPVRAGGPEMELFKRLYEEENGQGLVEYTFVVLLVALVFWMGVRDTNIGTSLANGWSRVQNCVSAPFSCAA